MGMRTRNVRRGEGLDARLGQFCRRACPKKADGIWTENEVEIGAEGIVTSVKTRRLLGRFGSAMRALRH